MYNIIDMILYWWCVILVFLCVYVCVYRAQNTREQFRASNASTIDDTKPLNDDMLVFRKLLGPPKSSLDIVLAYTNTPFENDFKTKVKLYLTQKVQGTGFQGDNLELMGAISNLQWKDQDNSRHFLFDVALINKSRGFALNCHAHIILKNLDYYTQPDDLGQISNLRKLNMDDLHVVSVGTYEETTNLDTKVTGYSVLGNKHYEISNTMYLMEPYITTGKSMSLSNSMRKDFKVKLQGAVV